MNLIFFLSAVSVCVLVVIFSKRKIATAILLIALWLLVGTPIVLSNKSEKETQLIVLEESVKFMKDMLAYIDAQNTVIKDVGFQLKRIKNVIELQELIDKLEEHEKNKKQLIIPKELEKKVLI